MLGETEDRFTLTRAALSVGERAKSNFLPMIAKCLLVAQCQRMLRIFQ